MIERMAELLRGRRVVVLTGAGCSTESGIPDYRGPSAPRRARGPIQYQEFMRSAETRVRYWSRSAIGWPRISSARPNPGHAALARMESRGIAQGLITQNVDGLHHAAGSRNVVELHGSLSFVRCMSCNERTSRADFQQKLMELNPRWAEQLHAQQHETAPDGDAELDSSLVADFSVPSCACGGILKPDVVFFGENVPAPTVQQAWQIFEQGEVLLVIGSSLTVFSGRRFIYRAQQNGIPIGIINIGPTRGDEAASVKLEAPIGEALPILSGMLE